MQMTSRQVEAGSVVVEVGGPRPSVRAGCLSESQSRDHLADGTDVTVFLANGVVGWLGRWS